jgi:hypothetical protein
MINSIPNKKTTAYILAISSVSIFIGVFIFISPIAQEIKYHQFANERTIASIPNFWNVVSNIGFICLGIWGLSMGRSNIITKILFLGMILTGLGSAYYHYSPNNQTLFWDRLPMTIVFSAFFGQIIVWYFDYTSGIRVWIGNLVLGFLSVGYWYYTETIDQGDLRFYALIQFLPIILIIILCSIHYKENGFLKLPLLFIFISYFIAKYFEHNDMLIYSKTMIMGGHPIKHIFASIATANMVWMVKRSTKTKQIQI